MRTVGVIAEYDPFHNGHARQLELARRAANADRLIVVMSGCFTQRGDAALLPPNVRARMALSCGADAVILLPAFWAVREAEHFALGGISLLHGLGADAVSFGAEDADAALLARAAELLAAPDETARARFRNAIADGIPYPQALTDAIRAIDPEAARVLALPNDLLGIYYIKALYQLGSGMDVLPVARTGTHGSEELADTVSPSAAALRTAIRQGDWHAASRAMPQAAYRILREAAADGLILRAGALDQALLYRLRTMRTKEYDALPGLSEGLADRLRAAASGAASQAELLAFMKTRRYPYTRLARLCTHALLQFTEKGLAENDRPKHAVVLGFRSGAEDLLARMAEGPAVCVTRRGTLPVREPWCAAEARAWDIYALAAGRPAGGLFRQGVIRV